MRIWLGLGVGATVIKEIKQLCQLAAALPFHTPWIGAHGGNMEKNYTIK